jgi:hypothetical protein
MTIRPTLPRIALFAFAFAFVGAATALAPGAASADILPPVSFELGAQVPTQSAARNAGGNAQTTIAAGYDFGPKTIIPIRASLQVDEATGSNGNGTYNEFGFGVNGRLTTPLYVGAGVSLYDTNAREQYVVPAGNVAGTGPVTVSSTSVGENFFIGERLISIPGGIDLDLEANYKNIPQFDGINPSAFGVGLRVRL